MKNTKKIIIGILCSIFIFTACQENEILTETPKDDIFSENLYQNYDGFRNGINGLVALVRKEVGIDNDAQYLWKLGVDNVFSGFPKGNEQAFNDYTDMNSEVGMIKSTFEWLYLIVNASNTIINRAEGDVNWQGGSPDNDMINKNKVLANARLMRAWAYRHLTGCWGAVPLSTEEITGANYSNAWVRTPVADIQDVMEADWLFAKQHLDMVEETGFPNAAVARHYLAELYLTQGRSIEAETEAKNLINSGEYQLMTERFGDSSYGHIPNPMSGGVVFMDLFANTTREEGNLESLWVLNNANSTVLGAVGGSSKNIWQVYSTKANELKNLNADIHYFYNGGRGRGRGAISDSAFNWYETFDDRFSEYAVKKYYIYPTNEEETVFEKTAYTSMDYDNEKDLEQAYNWPWVRKYEYVDVAFPGNWSDPFIWRPEMYIRLANTYMILAEALHMNDKDGEAAIYINAIRERSNASSITADDVDLEFILKERSRELVTEEDRRYVLNRYDLFVDWTIKYNPIINDLGGDIYSYSNLLPIPQNVIDANTGTAMEQNTGYKK